MQVDLMFREEEKEKARRRTGKEFSKHAKVQNGKWPTLESCGIQIRSNKTLEDLTDYENKNNHAEL